MQARIGIARVDITPPVGIYARNWGAARHDVATSIHRPLTLTALVIEPLDDASQRLVLLDADLGWWKTPQVFDRLRDHLLQAVGVSRERFVFALSHTHAGPPLMDPDRSLPGSELIEPWMERLRQRAEQAILQARESSIAARLEWHTGRCNLAAYRDLPDPLSQTSPPRIVCGYHPGPSADDTLLVGRITDLHGRILATLTNYACHPTTLAWDNAAISPDFVGALRETLERVTGAPAIFLQGASGELAPREQYVGDVEIADRHGRQLAYAALATLEDMPTPGKRLCFDRVVESGAPLAVWHEVERGTLNSGLQARQETIGLPVKDWPTAEQLESERTQCTDRALEERLRRKRDIRRALGDGKQYQLPLTVWQLGDAILVGTCCEAYSRFQTELRQAFPERAIVCMNLINGSLGYLPRPNCMIKTCIKSGKRRSIVVRSRF